jgi:hypothetical protein
MDRNDRLKYLLMRCVSCKEFLTKDEVIDRWEEMEEDGGTQIGLCSCGSRQIKPTNLTPEEEQEYTSLWQKFRYYVLRRRDRGTRILDLYEKHVKGQDLGPTYG